MIPLTNTTELIEYSKIIDRQREVLKLSTVFAPREKIIILQIYSDLQAICRTRINHLQDIDEALKL